MLWYLWPITNYSAVAVVVCKQEARRTLPRLPPVVDTLVKLGTVILVCLVLAIAGAGLGPNRS